MTLAASGRLRAVWRILLFVAVLVASAVVCNAAVVALFKVNLTKPQFRDQVISSWASLTGTLLATMLALMFLERRGWEFVSLDRSAAGARQIATGLLIGTFAIAIPSALLVESGWLSVMPASAGSWVSAALRMCILFAPAALFEELVVRGYVFQVLRESAGDKIAIASTSIVFGLLHLGNLHGQQFSTGLAIEAIAMVMLAGVFLAALLIVTRSMYAAWAAHFAWNFFLGAVLHSAVSGIPFALPDYVTVDAGPDWATGGFWGPEGGAGAALGMGLGLVYLFWRWRATTRRVNG